MAAMKMLNPKAETAKAAQALAINISASKALQDIMKPNFGPKGTMKMLVSGDGSLKITKDGNVLLHEMQIHHPTASLIARASTAQDDATGDGTTSIVLIIGELLKQAELYVSEGVHPHLLAEGFEIAKNRALEVLEKIKLPWDGQRETLLEVARTSLKTKVHPLLADHLTDVCVDAVMAIKDGDKPIDLFMVEIMEMQHRTELDTKLVHGLVLDHGARHPDLPKRVENAYILTCTVPLEYESAEVTPGFFYRSADERKELAEAEYVFVESRVQKIIDLKKKVCGNDPEKSFVVINQSGIDRKSLDMLAKEGILALRRAKRRNMERLTLACGGVAVNSVDNLIPECLGFAKEVYEQTLGGNKFTFIEGCENPRSVTILIKGSTKHGLVQTKDAIRDGLRAVCNVIKDNSFVPGGGAFEVAAYTDLIKYKDEVKGRARLGVKAYAEALLIIPKTLAQNSGFDPQETIVKLEQGQKALGRPVGLDLTSGEPVIPTIIDNYCVKKQMMNSCTVIASNLLLVDEIIKAGLSS